MSLYFNSDIPAFKILSEENRPVFDTSKSPKNSLKIGILNLMPKKISTETQLLRQLSYSKHDIIVDFIRVSSHVSKNTPQEHIDKFYTHFCDIKDKYYDGFIITGAPIEKIPFEQVDYWKELCSIMDWTKQNCTSVFYICWGAQAGLYYKYGIDKYLLDSKMFGIFEHSADTSHPILKDFPEKFFVPHSRHTSIHSDDIYNTPELSVLSVSDKAGIYLIADNQNNFFVTGHSEYDDNTLSDEYFRDVSKNLPINIPENYFIDDNPEKGVKNLWSDCARKLYSNWTDICAEGKTAL